MPAGSKGTPARRPFPSLELFHVGLLVSTRAAEGLSMPLVPCVARRPSALPCRQAWCLAPVGHPTPMTSPDHRRGQHAHTQHGHAAVGRPRHVVANVAGRGSAMRRWSVHTLPCTPAAAVPELYRANRSSRAVHVRGGTRRRRAADVHGQGLRAQKRGNGCHQHLAPLPRGAPAQRHAMRPGGQPVAHRLQLATTTRAAGAPRR